MESQGRQGWEMEWIQDEFYQGVLVQEWAVG